MKNERPSGNEEQKTPVILFVLLGIIAFGLVYVGLMMAGIIEPLAK